HFSHLGTVGNFAKFQGAFYQAHYSEKLEMAVPGRRNGAMEENEEDNDGLFEEEGLMIEDNNENEIPPHLRALAQASQLGNVDALRDALDNLNGSIDEAVEDGDTALHLTCLYGYLSCAQLLLERGASLEVRDEDGAIPLHDACAGGFTQIVQLLINSANNSDTVKRMLDTVDAEGDTPLHHAGRGEQVDVVRILLSAGASPTKENTYGKTPAELAEPETEARRIIEAAANDITALTN
ncbi:hypothetical protein GIB67_017194, partial [Kingdonia uniflora]